ncbi:hypothetical protein DHX103_11730 [Planococcus sp. X10-3]|uniref:hypothetical protein n=1 Tax=Planococcus sp. X10-3 TaxID=3061240 RepID=UPI003BAEB11D
MKGILKLLLELSILFNSRNIMFEKGYLTKGPTHSGRLHFKIETNKVGAMNTLGVEGAEGV